MCGGADAAVHFCFGPRVLSPQVSALCLSSLADETLSKANGRCTPHLEYKGVCVKGDGNCFWRALSVCICGSENTWDTLKLAVISWAVLNTDLMTGEGGPLYLNDFHYDGKITAHIGGKY